MFDIRSLFIVMVATNAVLALALWIGNGRRLQGGLAQWTLALSAQATAFALFAVRGHVSDWASLVAANGLLGVSFSLMAAAILAFRGTALPSSRMWPPARRRPSPSAPCSTTWARA